MIKISLLEYLYTHVPTPFKPKEVKPEPPILSFNTTREWNSWLAEHHATSKSINYAEALEEALCYGWIHG